MEITPYVEDVQVRCPHCGEMAEVPLETDRQGDLTQKCELCGRSFRMRVLRDGWGDPQVEVEALK